MNWIQIDDDKFKCIDLEKLECFSIIKTVKGFEINFYMDSQNTFVLNNLDEEKAAGWKELLSKELGIWVDTKPE